jgi:hypothetical protein
MIRPTQSGSPIANALLPTMDVPRRQGGAFELMPLGTEKLLTSDPTATKLDESIPGNQPIDDSVRFGQSDRHVLSDKHTIDSDATPSDPLREAFRDFVGQTLFGQMLSSMRSTVGKPAYFHGGRAEEVFSEQLDQVLVERITEASASTVADPMYDLFNMQRSQ